MEITNQGMSGENELCAFHLQNALLGLNQMCGPGTVTSAIKDGYLYDHN